MSLPAWKEKSAVKCESCPSQPRGHDGPLSAATRDQLAVPRVDRERGQRRRAEPSGLAPEGEAQQRSHDRQPRRIRAEEANFVGA